MLNDRLGRKSFSRPPGCDHIHVVLNSKFSHRRHGLRNFVGGIHQDHLDLIAGDASFDLIDIAEIVLLTLGMELSPGGCRTGQVDGRTDFNRLGRSGIRPDQSYGEQRQK